jgi:flavodoxin
MEVCVIVDSLFGNTERLAEAVAQGMALMSVRVLGAGEAIGPATLAGVDVLVVAGPTTSRGMSPRLRTALDGLDGSVRGMNVALFDTRYRGPEFLMGSAARRAEKQLVAAGAVIVVPRESFLVRRTPPAAGGRGAPADVELEPGELERAREWGRKLAATFVAGKGA